MYYIGIKDLSDTHTFVRTKRNVNCDSHENALTLRYLRIFMNPRPEISFVIQNCKVIFILNRRKVNAQKIYNEIQFEFSAFSFIRMICKMEQRTYLHSVIFSEQT